MARESLNGLHAWHNRGEHSRRMLKRLSSKAAASEGPEAYPLGYAEDLNDARTPLVKGAFWRTGVGG